MVTYLGRFAHPLIVPLIGFGIAPSQFLVTKFMPNRDLWRMLERERASKSPEGWDATAKSKCVFGIAAGMAFLHSKNIIHRDLKTAKVLLDDDFEPVIGGLGLAAEYIVGAEMEKRVGTRLFMAPEMVSCDERYDHKVDVYSFAVALYQFFTDSMVFDDGSEPWNPFHFYRTVGEGHRFKRADNIPDFYWDLICKCWSQDPNDRPSFVEIVKHLRAHTSEYAFEGSDLSLVREYEMHALESISDILSSQAKRVTTCRAIRFLLIQKLIFRNLMFLGTTTIVSVLLEVARMVPFSKAFARAMAHLLRSRKYIRIVAVNLIA